MTRLLPLWLVGAAVLVAPGVRADVPAADRTARASTLHVGKWNVTFTNGVIETCHIGNAGTSTVVEPLRRSNGRAEIRGGSVVLRFNDDRVERWTPVGRWFFVEHWASGSLFPTGTPVVGVAERVSDK